MALDFPIVCKTYRGDLRRTQRLLASLQPHNRDKLPVVLIVPSGDLELFRSQLPTGACEFVTDEDVVAAHPQAASLDLLARYKATPGNKAQQVVKSEAWRLLGCKAYLCTDADTVFLRPFGHADFVAPEGHPYSHVHQSKEYRQLAASRGYVKVEEDFRRESARLKGIFGRTGPDYDFGPTPVPWSAKVWNDLHEQRLAPQGHTLWDAIEQMPSELRWYGESLLAFQSIPLAPIEPLFRVYHHDWHFNALRRLGENEANLPERFIGAVYQSNWQYEMDEAGARSASSRAVRWAKRWLRQFRR
jgi:hypothetical protein